MQIPFAFFAVFFKTPRNPRGQSLIQVIIASAIIAVVMVAALGFYTNQLKANSFLEFQSKREQLRLTILGQFLNDPNNCACLFAGASPFATPGPSNLATAAPVTSIGRFQFIAPGSCPGATIPQPYVDAAGVDAMKLTSVQLNNIVDISGNYSGDLVLALRSTKEVLGPKDIQLKIPVAVTTSPAGAGLVNFVSCSTGSSSGGAPLGVCPAGLLSTGYDVTTGALQCQPPTYQ